MTPRNYNDCQVMVIAILHTNQIGLDQCVKLIKVISNLVLASFMPMLSILFVPS